VYQVGGTADAERIKGDRSSNVLFGGAGDDTLLGLDGDDTLLGGDGDDRILGGKGNDVLEGGLGNDAYVGGKGADTFVVGLNQGRDVIRDFRLYQGDTVALADGLTADDITIQRFGANGARLFAGDEEIAIVQANRFGAITDAIFTELV